MAFCARNSWMKPITAFSITMARIIAESSASPMAPETAAAAIRTMIMKSLNWSKNIASGERFFFSFRALGP